MDTKSSLLASLYWRLIRYLTGPFIIEPLKDIDGSSEKLLGYSVAGKELIVYMSVSESRVRYSRWYVPNQIARVYRITASTSGDIDDSLRAILDQPVYLPDTGYWLFSPQHKKRMLTLAYLETIAAKIPKT